MLVVNTGGCGDTMAEETIKTDCSKSEKVLSYPFYRVLLIFW